MVVDGGVTGSMVQCCEQGWESEVGDGDERGSIIRSVKPSAVVVR